ncbi:hypothetical protein ACFLX4_04155 [Chloroflexota bacterium]
MKNENVLELLKIWHTNDELRKLNDDPIAWCASALKGEIDMNDVDTIADIMQFSISEEIIEE